jgi:hypothetical protein
VTGRSGASCGDTPAASPRAREATPDADDLETVEARYRAAAAALSETA